MEFSKSYFCLTVLEICVRFFSSVYSSSLNIAFFFRNLLSKRQGWLFASLIYKNVGETVVFTRDHMDSVCTALWQSKKSLP